MTAVKGKVALVTGAASGIGFACARRFATEGATVVGVDLNPCDAWAEVTASSPASELVLADVTNGQSHLDIVNDAISKHGSVDVLLTAAGVGEAGPVNMLDEAAWDRIIDINLKGTFLAIKAVLEPMLAQRGGSIITVASVEGINGTEGGSAYNASKGGVALLTKNVAIDYGKVGIRCNCICPGFIETPMFSQVLDQLPDFKTDIQRQIKLGRFGQPEEIASAALFLASDEASYMTGQNLVVDGGYTAGHSHGITEMLGLV